MRFSIEICHNFAILLTTKTYNIGFQKPRLLSNKRAICKRCKEQKTIQRVIYLFIQKKNEKDFCLNFIFPKSFLYIITPEL